VDAKAKNQRGQSASERISKGSFLHGYFFTLKLPAADDRCGTKPLETEIERADGAALKNGCLCRET